MTVLIPSLSKHANEAFALQFLDRLFKARLALILG